EAGEFEGVHPDARRGTGAVIIWDEGTADIIRDETGHLSFVLHGSKLTGGVAPAPPRPRRRIPVHGPRGRRPAGPGYTAGPRARRGGGRGGGTGRERAG